VVGLALNRDNQKQLIEAKVANDKLNEALALADKEGERRERLEAASASSENGGDCQLTGGIALTSTICSRSSWQP